ncbi:MAG TPA: sulfotransferase [Pyrinomonadaceae bacterium]|nr:sulfotransferase [Pyrinomonadaceae bacterium]
MKQTLYRNASKFAAQQMCAIQTSTPGTGPASRHAMRRLYHPPVFILAAPRSYTSVVCAMLGQHPQMYATPELHLFQSETMAEWFELCQSASFPRAHGMLRAVAQLFFGEQREETIRLARSWLRERTHLTTGQLLRRLTARIYPATLVEKSPSVNMDQDSMARARRMFPRARFLHLVRHPSGQGASVLNYMKVRAQHGPIPPTHWLKGLAWYGQPTDDEREPDPQHAWYALNRGICQFLKSVPEGQQWTIRGEDVLARPEETLRPLLDWLNLRTDADAIERMKHPEHSPYACPGPQGAEFGNDRFFLQNPTLRPEKAPEQSLEGPVSWSASRYGLTREVVELARQFGYR